MNYILEWEFVSISSIRLVHAKLPTLISSLLVSHLWSCGALQQSSLFSQIQSVLITARAD